ncbi:MAG: exosortase/archaeosortase family protein [Promethearchaeota archaeon]
MKRSNVLAGYSSWLLFLVGTILIIAGGLIYALPQSLLTPFSLAIIVLGIVLLFQTSCAFQSNNDVKLILAIIVSSVLVIFIDFWPVQMFYSNTTASLLRLVGISSIQQSTPHFGGVQVIIFVREAVTNRIVGGEIDNGCAGLMALIPCLILLFLADTYREPKPERLIVGILAVCIIVLGNLFRIFVELWAPAVGLIPFEYVHYPLAFLLGYFGVTVIAILGQRILKREKSQTFKKN